MRAIIAIVAIAIIAVAAPVFFQAALEDAGRDHTVTNETFSPTADTIVQLDDSNRTGAYYEYNATVYNNTDVEMEDGTDYEWFSQNGTIKPLSGGDLAGDGQSKITYSFQQTTPEQRRFADALGLIPQAMGYLLLVGIFLMAVLVVRG